MSATGSDLTLDETLKALGLGHRKLSHTHNTGRREIFEIATGRVIGEYTAVNAWELVKGGAD